MTYLFFFLSIILLILLFLWLFGFFYASDFSVPSLDIRKFKKILVISPHPDDEVMTVGGTIGKHRNAILLILTKGERGMPDAHLDFRLKNIRSKEAQKVAKILGAVKLIHEDLGDGRLENNRKKVGKRIEEVIKSENPDLIITNDLSGGYGHPDHIACSQIVTELVVKKYPKVHLWYWTSPGRMKKMLKLPEHMAKDLSFKNMIVKPAGKVFIGIHNFGRIRSIYTYKSQYQSFVSASPFHPLPMWFLISMSNFEYFFKVI